MSKKNQKISAKTTKNSKKITKIQQNSKAKRKGQQYLALPLELIIQIISKLDKVREIRKCMLLSKEIRDMILKSPEITTKFIFTLHHNWKESLPHLQDKGKFIKNLKIDNIVQYNELIESILSCTGNVERLTILSEKLHRSSYDYYPSITEKVPKELEVEIRLPKLKFLSLEVSKDWNIGFLTNVLENLKDLNKLEHLEVEVEGDATSPETQNFEKLTNFICSLKNLKILKLKSSSYPIRCFPTRDVSEDVKFQLKELHLDGEIYFYQNFLKFLENQSRCIEIFKITGTNSRKCKVLDFCCMPKVKDLEYLVYRHDSIKLQDICLRFPKMEILLCSGFDKSVGIFESLVDLHVGCFIVKNFQNVKISNLKSLKIELFENFVDENLWKCFAESSPKIENLIIKSFEKRTKNEVLYILRALKIFKNIRTFKIFGDKTYCEHEALDDDVKNNEEDCYVKILLNVPGRQMKVSQYVMKNRKDMMKILRATFKGVWVEKFCWIVPENLKTVDTKI